MPQECRKSLKPNYSTAFAQIQSQHRFQPIKPLKPNYSTAFARTQSQQRFQLIHPSNPCILRLSLRPNGGRCCSLLYALYAFQRFCACSSPDYYA